jgi:hypothetical protein
MQPDGAFLTTSELLALASAQLGSNGYRVVRDIAGTAHSAGRGLLAEDASSVVSVVVFETWQQLETEWLDAQADLVDLLSRRLQRSAPKAWDGYLVLLCASPATDHHVIAQIERDTTRVRKIVATGDTLRTIKDIENVLDVLAPLEIPNAVEALEDVLDALPKLIGGGIDPVAVKTVVDAFRGMEAPLERLHALGKGA